MNPPTNIQNHFSQSFNKTSKKNSTRLFTTDIPNPTVHKLLVIWDSFCCLFASFFTPIFLIFPNMLFALLALSSYITFTKHKNFKSMIHKIYAHFRLVIVCCQILLFLCFEAKQIMNIGWSTLYLSFQKFLLSSMDSLFGIFVVFPLLFVSLHLSFALKSFVAAGGEETQENVTQNLEKIIDLSDLDRKDRMWVNDLEFS